MRHLSKEWYVTKYSEQMQKIIMIYAQHISADRISQNKIDNIRSLFAPLNIVLIIYLPSIYNLQCSSTGVPKSPPIVSCTNSGCFNLENWYFIFFFFLNLTILEGHFYHLLLIYIILCMIFISTSTYVTMEKYGIYLSFIPAILPSLELRTDYALFLISRRNLATYCSHIWSVLIFQQIWEVAILSCLVHSGLQSTCTLYLKVDTENTSHDIGK